MAAHPMQTELLLPAWLQNLLSLIAAGAGRLVLGVTGHWVWV